MAADDGGKEIVAGNERVLRARLSDAKFFWDQDRQILLVDRVPALADIVFHAKLGTQLERVDRIKALAREIAEKIGADPVKAERAALLCKADLTTGVVGEFPELQGIMGRYYALADGEDKDVADAIRDHYRPLGPGDQVPTNPISICVALADKLDQLVGFFAIDEKPTGSGDPYALRRAALGITRIVLSNGIRLSTSYLYERASERVSDHLRDPELDDLYEAADKIEAALGGDSITDRIIDADFSTEESDFHQFLEVRSKVGRELTAFLAERLSNWQGSAWLRLGTCWGRILDVGWKTSRRQTRRLNKCPST